MFTNNERKWSRGESRFFMMIDCFHFLNWFLWLQKLKPNHWPPTDPRTSTRRSTMLVNTALNIITLLCKKPRCSQVSVNEWYGNILQCARNKWHSIHLLYWLCPYRLYSKYIILLHIKRQCTDINLFIYSFIYWSPLHW